ncbi:MAG: PD-(D/E)XK nuclease family protein [Bdellovibrionota bacterium]|nr:PD-(D/E)XK nuclease family protein [Bdellovibrionota bacterium]
MVKVILWDSHEDLCKLHFLKGEKKKINFICPSPDSADDIRLIVQKYLDPFKVHTTTISNFIQKQLKNVIPLLGNGNYKFLHKVEVLMHFGVLWKKMEPKSPDYLFLKVYKLFSELRSYTLDRGIFAEALELCSKDSFKSALAFWDYMEDNFYIDEHSAVGCISEYYLETKKNDEECFVFWGFDFMSGLQIDFVKSLGENAKVFIPFPRKVYEASSFNDWINWIKEPIQEQKKLIFSKDDYGHEIRFVSNESLGKELKSIYNEKVIEKKISTEVEVIFPSNELDFTKVSRVPFGSFFFKIKNDLFQSILDAEISKLSDKFIVNIYNEKMLNLESDYLINFLEVSLREELQKEDSIKSLRRVKVLLSLIKNIKNIKTIHMSFSNNQTDLSITPFLIKLLKNVTELDLPRNFSIPLIGSGIKGVIKDLKSVDSVRSESLKLVIALGESNYFSSSDEHFSEDLFELLSSIGPVKRSSLIDDINKIKISELLKKKETILLIGKDDLNNEPFWSNFKNDTHDDSFLISEVREKNKFDIFKKTINEKLPIDFTWSSSSLQLFYDCKRKFYFKYIKGINSRFKSNEYLGYDKKGIIEHRIIESFFTSGLDWSENNFLKIVDKEYKDFLKKESINLSPFDYKKNFLEIVNFSRKGVESIISLKSCLPNINLQFEQAPEKKKEIKNVKGRIDLIAIFDSFIGIIDFKRSAAGKPSKKEFFEFKNIQLWFYLSNFLLDIQKITFFGFINLDELSDSLVFYRPEVIGGDLLKEMKPFLSIINAKPLEYDLQEKVDSFLTFERLLIHEAFSEKEFFATPRSKKICNYCDYKNICDKNQGSTNEVS